MANWNPPNKGEAFEFSVSLENMSSAGSFKANPTLAAGDVQISKDDAGFANLATLPSVSPAAGVAVKVELSATEMDADKVMVVFIDQTATKEWADRSICILTTTP